MRFECWLCCGQSGLKFGLISLHLLWTIPEYYLVAFITVSRLTGLDAIYTGRCITSEAECCFKVLNIILSASVNVT
jgi:hypothetical protein